jgi:hypothetical protein
VRPLDADGTAAPDGEAAGDEAAVDAGDAVAGGELVGDPAEQATTRSADRLRSPRILTSLVS